MISNSDPEQVDFNEQLSPSRLPPSEQELTSPSPMLGERRESLPSISFLTDQNRIGMRCHSVANNTTQLSTLVRECGTYSRSPELRISHKLAERKRRKELKDLFENLKDELPLDKDRKSSKWEILTTAIGHIEKLREKEMQSMREKEELQKELFKLKNI